MVAPHHHLSARRDVVHLNKTMNVQTRTSQLHTYQTSLMISKSALMTHTPIKHRYPLASVDCCFFLCGAGPTTPSHDKVYPCPFTPAPARGCWGGGAERLHIIPCIFPSRCSTPPRSLVYRRPAMPHLGCLLLQVMFMPKNMMFWTGSGPTSLLSQWTLHCIGWWPLRTA